LKRGINSNGKMKKAQKKEKHNPGQKKPNTSIPSDNQEPDKEREKQLTEKRNPVEGGKRRNTVRRTKEPPNKKKHHSGQKKQTTL